MTQFSHRTFRDATITLDGKHYDHCVFRRCRIVYSATGAHGVTNCEFHACKWSFTGAAARTVEFMAALYEMGGGGRDLIEKTFDGIRRGRRTDSGSSEATPTQRPAGVH